MKKIKKINQLLSKFKTKIKKEKQVFINLDELEKELGRIESWNDWQKFSAQERINGLPESNGDLFINEWDIERFLKKITENT